MSNNILRLKKAVHSFLHQLSTDPLKRPYDGDRYHCPVCDTYLKYFIPISSDYLADLDKYQCVHSLFLSETFNFNLYSCPRCMADDRSRLYALYFKDFIAKCDLKDKFKIIDFAPCGAFSDFLKKSEVLQYRSADLYMPNVDDKVDISDMHIYSDNSFDIFLCSHVLEHVDDDTKAMKELFRILKPGGWGIAMVPINLGLTESLEDKNIISPADRWKYYGQNDHVRFYAKHDFVKKLSAAGFQVNQFDVQHFGEEVFIKNGINLRSVLYIVQK